MFKIKKGQLCEWLFEKWDIDFVINKIKSEKNVKSDQITIIKKSIEKRFMSHFKAKFGKVQKNKQRFRELYKH